AGSDLAGSEAYKDLLGQIEAIHNEFADTNLTTHLDALFDNFSALANNPESAGERMQLVEHARTLTSFLQDQRARLGQLQQQVDASANHAVEQVNALLDDIAHMNASIATGEAGSGENGSLRDRRDVRLTELAQLIDISTNEQDNGQIDIHVGSTPLVLGSRSRGLQLITEPGELPRLGMGEDNAPLDAAAGKLVTTMRFRQEDLQQAIDHLDTLAHELIWQVNRLHSQGQPLELPGQITGGYAVADADAALNSLDAELDFAPGHGSFKVHLTAAGSDQRATSTIGIDLDPSSATPTTMNDLVAALDGVANLTAELTTGNRLRLTAADGQVISFSEDSSGVLAALGVNTFFTGSTASDIAVDANIRANPSRIAASAAHQPGDNTNAHALAGLRNQSIDALGGQSLVGYWHRHVEDFATRLGGAREQAEADSLVRDNLQSRQQAVSGVNPDEEAIDLLRHQRGFQASARFLTAVDEMMQTILNML
ncbi:MAG: flagellar basal body rod C-terminal domain-containing protein, partial [Phycisphaeraceae bacterium]